MFINRGLPAQSDLVYVLNNSVEPKVTARTVLALKELFKEKGVSYYRKALKDDSDIVRAQSLDAIREYGPVALLKMVSDLIVNERDPYPRVEATRAFVALSRKALLENPEQGKSKKKKKRKKK